jgi:hypothetical protein
MNHFAILFSALLALAGTAQAQHAGHSGKHHHTMKAMSADEAGQYAAGAGMGYAKAAELNHYPGPMHVLELAAKLELTPEQHSATKQLMDQHKTQARTIGAKLVAAEAALDRLFAEGKVTQDALARQVQTIATLQGEYRLSHLETHRRTQALLTRQQIMQYDRLRGYSGQIDDKAGGAAAAPAADAHKH